MSSTIIGARQPMARANWAVSSTVRTGASPDHPQVIDDFPAVVPVTQRELEVLETYLGALLDGLLKRTH